MQTTCIGFFQYISKKTETPGVAVALVANPIPKDKGDGYYVRNYYVDLETWNSKFKGLKAGKVDVQINPFNPYQIDEIKNI